VKRQEHRTDNMARLRVSLLYAHGYPTDRVCVD